MGNDGQPMLPDGILKTRYFRCGLISYFESGRVLELLRSHQYNHRGRTCHATDRDYLEPANAIGSQAPDILVLWCAHLVSSSDTVLREAEIGTV